MQDFKQHVVAATERPEAREAVKALYANVQREIDARRPLCIVSGRCCRFEEYGHRLFVTTLEMAAFMHDLRDSRSAHVAGGGIPLPQFQEWDHTGCPWQRNKLCTVHAFRPFGCRMFFCDATSTEWQNEQYERFHAELKQLHQTLDIPYFYVEWRQALRDVL